MEDLRLFDEVWAGPVLGDEAVEDPTASVEQVGDYLHAPSVSPVVFRRVAARFPERIDDVMRAVLDRDDFVWARDGEALLEQHRPNWRPTLSVTGLEPEYVAAIRRLRDAR